ncbi:MAG: ABC transporter substrate-binding protein [Tissierellia bacterium]|jgi:iron complex transport system substrate-binding protein|nr:ABC transporter substrate-binding protein [Tissierellia bacterium]
MQKRFINLGKILILILVLSLALVGCKGEKEPQGSTEIVGNNDEGQVTEGKGLVKTGELDLKYASSFSVEYYEGGYKMLTDIYDMKTLLIPEGKEVPEVAEDVNILHLPVDSFGVFSTVNMTMLRALDSIDKATIVTTPLNGWYVDDVIEKMENEEISFVGDNNSPDYELIQAANPDLILLTGSQSENTLKMIDMLDTLDIDWIGMTIHMENDPRGRLEWVKFMGALLDKEAEAEAFFEKELARITEIENNTEESTEAKPKVAYVRITDDGYTVKNKGDYSVKMLEIAGGNYIFSDLNPDKDGTLKISAEEFYKVAENVDILIYENMGAFVGNMEQLMEKGEHLDGIKAIREGRVWVTKQNYWQSADKTGEMIEELRDIFLTPHGELEETQHYLLAK